MSITYLLIGINVAVSLIAFTRMNSGPSGAQMFLFSPYHVAAGKNYAGMVLSHLSHGGSNAYAGMFLSHLSHADGMHLLFNMMTLYYFGPVVEEGLGPVNMLLIYVVSAILSTVVVYYRHRHDPNYRSLGASDSVSGILFAAIVLLPSMTIFFIFLPFPIPAPLFAVGYIILSTFFMQRGKGNISHEAHLAGAFCGLVLAGMLSPNGFGPLVESLLGYLR